MAAARSPRAIDARTEERRDARRGAGVRERHRATSTSSICVPLPGGRWNYTHKFAAFAVTGHVDDRRPAHRLRATGTRSARWTSRRSYALRHAVWQWIALVRPHASAGDGDRHQPRRSDARRADQRERRVDRRQAPSRSVARRRSNPTRCARRRHVALTMRDGRRGRRRSSIYRSCDIVLRHVVGAFSRSRAHAGGQVRTSSTNVVGIYEDYDTWW